jgi:MFS family permease
MKSPRVSLLLSVALLSAAVLGFEVALTRVFAVLLRYHFAFLVVSIAVCGLGVGGYAAFWIRRRRALSLPITAALFAFTILLALTLMLRVVFARFPESYWMAALLVLIPFSCAGAFLAEVFARFPAWSGRLYAWDLAGAALAALAIVGVLQYVSAIDACVLMAALAACAGVLVSSKNDEKRAHNISLTALVLLMACFALNSKFRFLDIPPIPPRPDAQGLSLADKGMTQPLFTELGDPAHSTSRIIETRWSAFARTDVVHDTQLPNSYYLYTNGNVPTNMMQWDGNLKNIAPIAAQFPLSDWAFAVAPLGEPSHYEDPREYGEVLSIGPGGGLDALLALHHGAKGFDGVEINPSIVQLMKEPKYSRYNGGIYQRSNVNIQVADGRAFVREAISQHKKYALLYSALTKTATAGQGMALLESFIYTTDAFSDYLDVLKDDGQITIVLDNPILTARFCATALDVFRARGVNEKDAMRHIAVVHDPRPGPYVFALVIKKKPFTRVQTFELEEAALKRELQPVWIPLQSARENFGPYPQLASGELNLEGFVDWFRNPENTGAALEIVPCPDDRPFVLDLNAGVLPVFKQLAVFALVLALGVLAASWRTSNIQDPTSNVQQDTTQNSMFDVLYIAYFLALGIGFMLVEIPLAQKLILPLGYPTLALTVILFSILLGGGAGAWFSQRFEKEKLNAWAMGCALGIAIFTSAGVLALPLLETLMLSMSLPARCALATTVLLPLGFLLGAPFPSGMRLFSQTDFSIGAREEKIPLIWGLNGVASVLGSLLAAMGAKNFGFSAMLGIGAAVYVLAALLLRATQNTNLAPASDEAHEKTSD